MIRLAIALLATLSAFQAPPESAAPDSVAQPKDLAAVLEPLRAKHDLPAMGAAVVWQGRTLGIGVCGVRKRGEESKVTLDDAFHLGSCSKAMTATLCARLVEQKKLAWDSPVGPRFQPVIQKIDAGWNDARLEQLLTNCAGAPGSLDAGGLWAALRFSKEEPRKQRLALAKGVLAFPPQTTPGATYAYSNGGFALAGAMAEIATDVDFETLMRRELFEPLRMAGAGFGPPEEGKAPCGHHANGKPAGFAAFADNPAAISPAGRIHAPIGDWAKFIALHLDAENQRARFLEPDSFRRLHAPGSGAGESYAMGWLVGERPWAGGRVLMHSGSNTMWFCTVWIAPEKDIAFLVATNQGGDAAAAGCDEAVAALIGWQATARGQ